MDTDPETASSAATSRSRWARATQGDGEALRELAESYWYCVYAWWRRAGLDAALVPAATESSFTRWLGVEPPAPDDPGAARMRDWMQTRLASLLETGNDMTITASLQIDTDWAEHLYAGEPIGTSEEIFQRRWALTILEFAHDTLQAEYTTAGRELMFANLLSFAGLEMGGEERYEVLAKVHDMSAGAARRTVFKFRARYREVLHTFIGDTLADLEDIDSEMAALLRACDFASSQMTVGDGIDPVALSIALPTNPTSLGRLPPEELLARAMHTARMTGGGARGWEPPSLAEAVRLFPNFEVLGLLGRGGMGAVYQARQTALDRLVAIKLLPLEISVDGDFADRFRREARALAKLNHPNIITVYDFGQTTEGHLFFIMEFVEGANLHTVIHRGRGASRLAADQEVGGRVEQITPDQALSIAAQICTALAYAHGKGIVHRDIKPANVMIDPENQVKVADFGLARLIDDAAPDSGHTATGAVMGTPNYMAPEQKRGLIVDHRADIYSLGVTLYEMLCGEPPHGAFDLPSARTGCDTRIDVIVIKAMKSSPERRYQSTEEMKCAVESALTPLPVLDSSASPSVADLAIPAPRATAKDLAAAPAFRKSKTPLYAGIASTVFLLAAAAFFHYKSKPESTAEPQSHAARHAAESSTIPPAPAPSATPTSAAASSTPPSAPAPATPTPDTPAASETAAAPVTPVTPVTPAPPKPPSELEKWLAQVDAPEQAAFQRDVVKPYEAGAADLRARYLAVLDQAITKSSAAGKLDEAVALRADRQVFQKSQNVAVDDTGAPPSMKPARAAFRQELARLDQDRAARAKVLHGQYDAILAQNETALTKRQRLDDALLLKAKREDLVKTWLTPVETAASAVAAPGAGEIAFAFASKERPFVNSLGMKFVPVPIAGGPTSGQRVLFSIWETRVQDYAAFATETKRAWPNPSFKQGATHPAVNISWEDAQAFCEWLNDREKKTGRAGGEERYRLPSDHEWSCAVGIGEREDPDEIPKEKLPIPGVFPWGPRWPPPSGAGNYRGEEAKSDSVARSDVVVGYNDGFDGTAPVGSFTPNAFGLFDLGGNAWEWCEDWSDGTRQERVGRGGSFDVSSPAYLLSSYRVSEVPSAIRPGGGFRVVLDNPNAAAPAPDSGAPPVVVASTLPTNLPLATKDKPFVNPLGMKFVPVPGTRVLFSIWETRVRDYAKYARVSTGVDPLWTQSFASGIPTSRKDDDPVVGINWNDAHAFCRWLTKHGGLPAGTEYRLPSDEEWSRAVRLTREIGATPAERARKTPESFPWGSRWPPKDHTGNYQDTAWHREIPDTPWIEGYTDGFVTTSPVGSFAPNALGLYDLSGNAWEWCEDLFDPGSGLRVLRGGSYDHSTRADLASAQRIGYPVDFRLPGFGFRCVIASRPK